MIGLEFMLKNSNLSSTELAERLGIKKQNISRWFSGERNIPLKYIPILQDIFNIPEEYFQKELAEIDKFKLQRLKFEQDVKEIENNTLQIDFHNLNTDIEKLINLLESFNGKLLKVEVEAGFSSIAYYRDATIKFRQFEENVEILILDKERKSRMIINTSSFVQVDFKDNTIEITSQHGALTKISTMD